MEPVPSSPAQVDEFARLISIRDELAAVSREIEAVRHGPLCAADSDRAIDATIASAIEASNAASFAKGHLAPNFSPSWADYSTNPVLWLIAFDPERARERLRQLRGPAPADALPLSERPARERDLAKRLLLLGEREESEIRRLEEMGFEVRRRDDIDPAAVFASWRSEDDFVMWLRQQIERREQAGDIARGMSTRLRAAIEKHRELQERFSRSDEHRRLNHQSTKRSDLSGWEAQLFDEMKEAAADRQAIEEEHARISAGLALGNAAIDRLIEFARGRGMRLKRRGHEAFVAPQDWRAPS